MKLRVKKIIRVTINLKTDDLYKLDFPRILKHIVFIRHFLWEKVEKMVSVNDRIGLNRGDK